ncbi:MAG TPA: restriction endonuclease subunit S [Chthoniobacterales bacterium]|nr:restriction endonuclease subunit S [Chthoniobacterales bacterium]
MLDAMREREVAIRGSSQETKEGSTLPAGWEHKTVGEMVEEMQYGTSAKTSLDASGVPVLRMGNIKDGSLVLDALKFLPATHKEFPALLLQDGDLLFNRTNSAELVGKSAVYRGNPSPCACASYLIRARLKPGYVPEFLAYYINSTFGRAWIRSVVSQQVGQANVNGTKLKALSVPAPSLPEQQRIVAEIEKQFTRLEAGVAALRRVQANLKRYRAAVLKAACEGRLVATEAELAKVENRKFESGEELLARILTERRQSWQGRGKYREPAAPGTTSARALPNGWTWASVAQVSATIVDCPHSTAKFVADGLPCVDTTCIKPGRIVRERLRFVSLETFRERVERLIPITDDIIFAREGTVGTAVAIPADMKPCLGQRVMLMRADACILPRFFEHCLNSQVVRVQYLPKIVGSTAPHINVADVKLLALPLPPLAEQVRIVAEVDRCLSVVEGLQALMSDNLRRATRLRQSVLQRAFSGGFVKDAA